VWESEYRSQYRSLREQGAEVKNARKGAKSVADKTGKLFAKTRAIEAARARAQADLDSGDAFTETAKKDLASDRAEYDAGTHGSNAQRLSSELNGKSMAEVQAILDADASAGLCTKTPTNITVKGGKTVPQDVYLYKDGTMVRVKPQGDGLNNQGGPMYSIEVIKKGVANPQTQGDVDFKVDGKGNAVPKGPSDAANPYDKAKNPEQWKAWMEKVINAGHRSTKEP
jgi:hypothetical protein